MRNQDISTQKVKKISAERKNNAKIVAVMNNKGGCGKTTTAIALGLHAARAGYNVLLWDNDPQCNLSQRLGLPDHLFKDKRLDRLFASASMLDSDAEQPKLAMLAKYPYLYRLQDSVNSPGIIGIMAGSHRAETNAIAAEKNLEQNLYLEPEQRSIFRVFKNELNYYKNYFDFIVMDTSPAMEGNILCRLAARTADEIVTPIDGLEAATGIKNLFGWLYAETDPIKEVATRPNISLAMVKYQDDTKNLSGINPAKTKRNAVYRVLKEALPEFVCDNGIKELASLRNRVYGGFGRKTDFDGLCDELLQKMNAPRPNIFSVWNREVSNKLENQLSNIEAMTLEKRPEFKSPKFEN